MKKQHVWGWPAKHPHFNPKRARREQRIDRTIQNATTTQRAGAAIRNVLEDVEYHAYRPMIAQSWWMQIATTFYLFAAAVTRRLRRIFQRGN